MFSGFTNSLKAVALSFVAIAMAGCSAIDAVDTRSYHVNEASADYSSLSILSNIIRASRYEPLQFVSLTGFTGHNTLNAGLPSFTLPPPSPVAVGISNSTGSSTFSNDFNVSVLDDPGSYSALLRPVDPQVLYYLEKAGYPRELLYVLFVEKLKIYESDGSVDVYNNFPEPTGRDVKQPGEMPDCANRQKGTPNFYKTICKLETLVQHGLTIQIGRSPYESSAFANYAFCYDKQTPTPYYGPDSTGFYRYFDDLPGRGRPQCSEVRRFDKPIKDVQDREYYEVREIDGARIQIHLRSINGVYQFLGQILHNQFNDAALRFADTQDKTILNLKGNGADGCFVVLEDRGENFCVPNDAANTKRIFSILRQLTGLLTRPKDQPVTLTTRSAG